ncbi:condensation domain-containing protein, partial [Streptomyces sp. SM12]
PLTANGKLDRAALPEPTTTATDGRTPRTPLETTLTTLFTTTLTTPHPLTIDDNFFDHGGHSLLAARLTNHIRTHTGTHLTIRDIFHHPTPASLAHHITQLGTDTAQSGSLTSAVGRPERLPLSFAQRRLWLLAAMEERGTAYNVPMAARLSGLPDPAVLRAAVADLVERHEPLRTVYATHEGEPVQRVLPPGEPAAFVEHRRLSAGELPGQLAAAGRHAFDLEKEPPLRVTVFDTGDGGATLLVLLHHIATDGQSLGPLFEDLATAYAARAAGTAPAWAPLPVQYADYALWQQRTLGDPADENSPLGRDLAFWRKTLEELPEELPLNLDRPRPSVAGHRGATVPVDFGPELYARLTRLAQAERSTPFMVLQAALAAALTRLGAGEDIPLGSPVAGRPETELAPLVGFFVNTLVLRTDTSGNPTFRELLGRVRAADLDAFAHENAPFDQVLEAVAPRRSPSRHPLFQVCLALESGPPPTVRLAGLEPAPASVVDTGGAKFDLEFLLRGDETDGLGGALLYNRDLFEEETARRMVGTLRRVLDHVLREPDTALSAIEVLDGVEWGLVVEEWNNTAVPIGQETLNTLFEHQARIHPDHTAVIFNDEHTTYRRLNENANRLAHHLTHCAGIRRGDLIGVLHDRSTTFATTLIALTKTGAAYTVLDPDFPDTRLNTTLTRNHITTVITDTNHTHRITAPHLIHTDHDTHHHNHPAT